MVNLQSDVAADQPAARYEEAAESDDEEGGEDGGETDHQNQVPGRYSLHHPPVATSGMVWGYLLGDKTNHLITTMLFCFLFSLHRQLSLLRSARNVRSSVTDTEQH